MEDDAAGAILKADGQKEDDAAPPVALWDSWFYRRCKSDKAMVNTLAENWQYLLSIFPKFSLRWQKRRQLRSWIAFKKRYQISSHINERSRIKEKPVSYINKGRGVNTQKEYQWSNNGRDCSIRWSSKQRVLIPILKY